MKLGFTFGEHIKTEKIKRRKYSDDPVPPLKMRGFLIPLLLIIAGLLLLYKTIFLQIIHGSDYRALADSNRIRTQIIHAPRGTIMDRNGVPMVYNVPGFRQIDENKKEDGQTKLLKREQALDLIAKGDQAIEIDSLRQYPFKDATAHLIGYIGQISKEELDIKKSEDYQANDWIGKTGIERQYEDILRGIDGKRLIEVDALGKQVRSLGQTDPIPGEDIRLTIDSKLQLAAYKATKDVKRGAIIVSRPNGEILAMFSKPTFDPNLFTLDATYKPATDSAYQNITSILTDTSTQPLLNRTISGVYPPGSTFKIITAASGLQNKIIDQNYRVADTGILRVGEFSYANWFYTQYGRKEPGELDVSRALARSNDIFFYKLAEKIGVDRLSETGKKFGLGQRTGIDLGGEVAGLLPTKKWKEENVGEGWYLGDTFHYGIGQGFLLTTPLQVNSWTETVANGGTVNQPRLLMNLDARTKNKDLVNEKTTDLIRKGMIESCSPGGVAWPLFKFKVQNEKLKIDGKNFLQASEATVSAKLKDYREVVVACKTGTAQHGGEETLPHAWITLFAPAYNPEIIVTVLVEESGEGSNVAAPVAKKILEAYFAQ